MNKYKDKVDRQAKANSMEINIMYVEVKLNSKGNVREKPSQRKNRPTIDKVIEEIYAIIVNFFVNKYSHLHTFLLFLFQKSKCTENIKALYNILFLNSMNRRDFLKLMVVVGAAVTVAPAVPPIINYFGYFYNDLIAQSTKYLVANNKEGLDGYPKYKVVNINDYNNQVKSSGCPVYFFSYPLSNEPCFLVDLSILTGSQIPNVINPYYNQFPTTVDRNSKISGAGTNNSIYAYSDVCVHLGCQLPAGVKSSSPNSPGLYYPGAMLHCPCHGSIYNLEQGGVVVAGPAPRALPMIVLEYDSNTGDIYAVGCNAPYFSSGVPRRTPSDNLIFDPRYSYSTPSNPSCS
jgi:Rieske Fe-S protein